MKRMTREEQAEAQTGSVGRFKQGEPHPELLNLWFWRYYPDGREYWVTAERMEKMKEGLRRATKRFNQNVNVELLEKTCPECGAIFHTRFQRALCCSPDCSRVRKERWESRRRHRFRSSLALGLGEVGEDAIHSDYETDT